MRQSVLKRLLPGSSGGGRDGKQSPSSNSSSGLSSPLSPTANFRTDYILSSTENDLSSLSLSDSNTTNSGQASPIDIRRSNSFSNSLIMPVADDTTTRSTSPVSFFTFHGSPLSGARTSNHHNTYNEPRRLSDASFTLGDPPSASSLSCTSSSGPASPFSKGFPLAAAGYVF